jgi:hypothetical protein
VSSYRALNKVINLIDGDRNYRPRAVYDLGYSLIKPTTSILILEVVKYFYYDLG